LLTLLIFFLFLLLLKIVTILMYER
jgi:hypothetical protein